MSKLSICIPTYNRARFLEKAIESVLSQMVPGVEIVVSDNASSDTTQDLMETYARNYAFIRYHRWPQNTGLDRNLLKVVELASADYCWYLGDDDELAPDALRTMLARLDSGNDIYLCDEVSCDVDLRPISRQRRVDAPTSGTVYEFSRPAEIAEFFRRSNPVGGIPLGFMSVLVFRRAMWNRVEYDEAFAKSGYSHVLMLLGFTRLGGRLEYVGEPLVLNRCANVSYVSVSTLQIFWITADGYVALADAVFPSEGEARDAFLGVARRIYPWKQIALIRNAARAPGEWDRVKARLRLFGYPPLVLGFFGAMRQPLALASWALRKLRGQAGAPTPRPS